MVSFERLLAAATAAVGTTTVDVIGYVAVAGLLWLVFYVLFRQTLRPRKVIPRDPTRGQIGIEIIRSARSLVVFGLMVLAVRYASLSGYTRIYYHIAEHSWGWFFASVVIAIVLHDAYFYWSHRLLHHPWLFRRVHRTHHLSANPTPWAAYSFSMAEALVQAGIGPIVVCLIPIHPIAFALFMAWQIAFNVFGHCGYEIFPRWFLRTWFGQFLNTPTHHALHHEKVRGCYSLYFNIWDRLMGTNHPDYAIRFDQSTSASDCVAEERR